MKRLLLIVSFFLLLTPGFAQKRAANWCFGKNAGLNFPATGSPSVFNNCRQDAFEASASISDLSGNLLLYTDGLQIWNKEDNVIQNGTGIRSNSSASQGAIFIPKPGSKTIFYLFTLDDTTSNAFNLYCTEIDLSLNNGLGGVSSNKNILVKAGVSERMAATWKEDGAGIWLAVRDASSATFYTFLVSAQGVQMTPIATSVGSSTTAIGGVQAGQMKFTTNGKYLAWACKGDRFVEVLDFNNENGSFNSTWSRKVYFNSIIERPYGIEFSDNGRFLYTSLGTPGILQLDMGKIVSESLFNQSKLQVSTHSAYGMQLARNGAIYIANYSSRLHAILAPNELGANCDYEPNLVSLGSGFSRDGTPSFISTYFLDKPISTSDSCVGMDIRFKYHMEYGDSLRWYFGDPVSGQNTSNQISPVHKYTATGDYQVELLIYNDGTPDTVKYAVRIHGYPQFTLGSDTTICFGQQYLLSPSVNYGSYLWQDGRTLPVYSVLNPGLYHVRVEKNGCASYDSVNIIIDKPQVELVVSSVQNCANRNAFNFTINQTGLVADVLWTFGDGDISTNRQVTHSYAGAGLYDVKVQTTNGAGCVTKAETQVVVKELVPALVSTNKKQQCFEGHVFEAAYSGDPDHPNLLSYSIGFSDGYLKKDGSVSHSFTDPGKKSLFLITTSREFCKDTAVVDLEVYANPLAKFNIDSSFDCQADNAFILNGFSSSSANGPVVSWEFESNGIHAFSGQTTYTYPLAGTYPVSLHIVDAKGCHAGVNKVLTVHPNPIVDFKWNESNNCIGTNPVQTINLTTLSSGTIDSYNWDFGDGETSTLFEPQKQFLDANTYVVKLTAVSDQGCRSAYSRSVVTYEVPVANFEILSFDACLNENRLNLINTSTIKGGDHLSYEWNLDGDRLNDKDVSGHVFTTEGPKLITLKVTSDKGCVNEMQTSVMVLPSPSANFTLTEPVQCLTDNHFEGKFVPKEENSPVESFVWTLHDSRVFDGAEVSFSYTESGVYPFDLEVKNMAGCITKTSGIAVVSPQPKASFSADPVCRSSYMDFTNSSSISDGSIVSYTWFFGDNEESQDEQPTHKYALAGEYPVFLEVTSNMGCKDYLVKKVEVKAEPLASFHYRKYRYEADIAETIYEFVCHDYVSGNTVNWYVNGQKVASGEKAFIGFKDTGLHEVTMLVENGQGCPAAAHHTVFVIPPFELYLPTAFSPNGDGLNETFRPEGNSYISKYEMIIVNRWGSVIFHSHSLEQGWDGTFSGSESETGVYLYYIKLTDIEGAEWEFKGNVLLVK